jgi:hypothetical protein
VHAAYAYGRPGGISCRSGVGVQAAGLGCPLWFQRYDAAAIAVKIAIKMKIFIVRFTVSLGSTRFQTTEYKPSKQITFQQWQMVT